jgi:hypothetical protein
MVRIFDEDDYRRRLDALAASNNISTSEEAGLLLKGMLTGTGFGPLNARQDIFLAKQRALIEARRALIRAIRAEEDKARQGAVIPLDVQEIVTGNSDTLVKVP